MLIVGGIGPGSPKYLTVDMRTRIEEGKYILAFGRVAASLKEIRGDIVQVNKVEEILNYISQDRETLLLASGDPNFYGIVDFLKAKGISIREVIPGLSSFQYMMSKLQKSWQHAFFLSLHGRKEGLEDIRFHHLSILLTDKVNTPDKISQDLYKLGIRGKIYAGFNLSYEDEKIIAKNIGEEIQTLSPLGVVVVENEMD